MAKKKNALPEEVWLELQAEISDLIVQMWGKNNDVPIMRAVGPRDMAYTDAAQDVFNDVHGDVGEVMVKVLGRPSFHP